MYLSDNAAVHHTRAVLTATTADLMVFYRHIYIVLTLIPVKVFFSKTKSWIASNDVICRLCDEPERMVQ